MEGAGTSYASDDDGGKEKKRDPAAAAQRIATALNQAANIIEAFTNGTLQDKIGAIAGALDTFIPGAGGIFGAAANLFGSIFNKKQTVTVDKIIDPVRTFPANLDYGYAAASTSSLYGSRFSPSGAGFTVHISPSDGAEKYIETKVTSMFSRMNYAAGLS